MPLSQPLIPHPGFNNDTLQPSVISTTVTAGPSLSQWTFINKYSNFINTGHGSSKKLEYLDRYCGLANIFKVLIGNTMGEKCKI